VSHDAPIYGAIDSTQTGSLSAYVHANLIPDSVRAATPVRDLPSQITFTNDIYPSPSAKTQLLQTDPSKISFTTPAEDAKSGKQPDYYLNTEGKLVKNPKATPSSDGSVKIEVEGNNSAKQAKQYADKLQKQAIGDLVSAFKAANPGTKVPEMWQSILDAQPDASYPNTGDSQNNSTVTPAEEQAYEAQTSPAQPAPPTDNTPAPQPQPSDTSSGGGGSSSNGGGGGGGSDSGSGGGSSGGGGTSGGGGGMDSGSNTSTVPRGSDSQPTPVQEGPPPAPGTAAARLVEAAQKELTTPFPSGEPHDGGHCLAGVAEAMRLAGLNTYPGQFAYQYGDALAKDSQFKEIPANGALQPGDIIVHTAANMGNTAGHIAIVMPGGKEISDIERNLIPPKAGDRVFRPN
jgi:hypothetical protein